MDVTGEGADRTYEEALAEVREKLRTKTGRKHRAQELLMHGIANVLGYWTETSTMDVQAMTAKEQDEFHQVLQHEADRIAKLFGYEYAWTS